MQAVVGESDRLVLWRRVDLVEQAVPRFDRGAVPGLRRGPARVLDPGGQRVGAGLGPAGRSACRARGRCAARRRKGVLDVVVVIVEAVTEAVELTGETVCGTGPYPHPPGRN